tara:strand:- start:700 stop:1926 length:1227 start_codon:yes stop_codon:yes gene_type:complete
MLNFVVYLLLFIVSVEIFLFILVNLIKKDFQWVITEKDEFPFNSNLEFKNFLKNNFDKTTGWDRKKNTQGSETLNQKKTYFKITNEGFRNTPFKNKKSLISVFGDSYAFCRYVNDEKTWEAKLEKKIKYCVQNFGVGNFGLDQSFLKYKKTKLSKSIQLIIFAFVPETIVRINSYWKHYNEFGNKFGFKPFFKIKKKKLFLKKNILYKQIKLGDLKKKILKIKKEDVFYKKKFKHYMFKFPYTFSYIKSFERNNIIFFNILIFKILKSFKSKNRNKFYQKSYNKVMKDNIKEANKMYFDQYFSNHLKSIMIKINQSVKNKNKRCIFLILPQLHDIFLIKKNIPNYQTFFEQLCLENKLNILDITKYFLIEKNLKKMYLEDNYGGHLSEKGNDFIAKQLYKYITKKQLL